MLTWTRRKESPTLVRHTAQTGTARASVLVEKTLFRGGEVLLYHAWVSLTGQGLGDHKEFQVFASAQRWCYRRLRALATSHVTTGAPTTPRLSAEELAALLAQAETVEQQYQEITRRRASLGNVLYAQDCLCVYETARSLVNADG